MKHNNEFDKYKDIKHDLAFEIKFSRMKKKLTQQEVADQGITTRRILQDMEAGKGTWRLDYLIDLIYAFDIDPQILVDLINKYKCERKSDHGKDISNQ